MKTKQTNQTKKEPRYDLCIERTQRGAADLFSPSPAVGQMKRQSLLDIYYELIRQGEPWLRKWILTNCRFGAKNPKKHFEIFNILPSDLKKLDKYLATDPLGLADMARSKSWSRKRTIAFYRITVTLTCKLRLSGR